jgi:hypothetical protein
MCLMLLLSLNGAAFISQDSVVGVCKSFLLFMLSVFMRPRLSRDWCLRGRVALLLYCDGFSCFLLVVGVQQLVQIVGYALLCFLSVVRYCFDSDAE